jgi:single-strand DNA-binding protein
MNNVTLLGRLTKDPDMRYTTGGTSVCTFTLAVDRFKKDEADFINIVTWNKTADLCEKYLAKGRLVALVGRIQTRNYEGTDGKKVYVTEVVADQVKFLPNGQKQEAGGIMDGAVKEQMADMPFNY